MLKGLKMTISTFHFKVYDGRGKCVKHLSKRCDNVAANERTVRYLELTDCAVAAFGVEAHGRRVHSAYRH
ncbi:MAG: hypothetical protein KJN99_08820 [Marinicaulis sp.]|nr:hypothetical protein [Marinicaulis sp.]